MKKLIKIFSLFLFTLNSNCQTLPLNSMDEPNNGGYLKDLDNKLPFWVGTWKGVAENKEYTFEFNIFLHQQKNFSIERYYYVDELVGKFKVVDLVTNNILYNDLMVTNFEDYKISLLSYNQYNGYSFLFNDDELHCDNLIEFQLIKNPSNPNQINYVNFSYSEFIPTLDCPYSNRDDIPMFLPKVDLILVRE